MKRDFKQLKINIYILGIFLLLAFSLFYFLYYRQKNQAYVYISVSLIKNATDNPSDQNSFVVPRWIGDSIATGDKDRAPLSGVNAEILEKEEYEGWSNGKFVYLTLKATVNKDKSGIYLYKSKPLLVGSIVDLKLTKTQTQGLVTYLGSDLPQYKKEKLTVKIKGEKDSWIADSLKIGSTITDDKGEILVKITDKKLSAPQTSGMRYDSATGKFISTDNTERKDLEMTMEITAEKIGEYDYFAKTQKIKVNEWLYLPFKEVSLSLPIVWVEAVK